MPICRVRRNGSGEIPRSELLPLTHGTSASDRLSRLVITQPHGSKKILAPRMRAYVTSNGVSVPPRDGSAVARAITMNAVQINTVTNAADQAKTACDDDETTLAPPA